MRGGRSENDQTQLVPNDTPTERSESMAFGGTIKRGARIDTRRRRRINPFGPNHGEQAKLRGYNDPPRFCGKAERQEMRNPDMTPVPRRVSGQLVRLYLPGRTIIASAVLGDGAFDDFF